MDSLARGLAWKGGAIIVILLVLLIVLWANLNSMISENCTNRIISEVPSPDGSLKAVIFQRDCGIDTVVSTHVSLLPAAETLPNRKGNVFITEGRAKWVQAGVVWTSPTALALSHKSLQKQLRRESSLMGVTVSYPATGGPAVGPKEKK